MTPPSVQLAGLAGLSFTKMTGSGNDFILVDNRAGRVSQALMPLLAKAVCARGRSAGADGLICLRPTDRVDPKRGRVDFIWDFFNSDGSSAEMCGNGGRCAARFAHDVGLAGDEMVFDTLAGPIRAWVEAGRVKLEMVPPFGAYEKVAIETAQGVLSLDGINTGVPHAVIMVDDIEKAPVREAGRELRWHQQFAPAGTNVNFASVRGDELWVRTYERGVEDETLACGTGAVASALIAGRQGLVKPPVSVKVRSGETLTIHFDGDDDAFGEVFLEGPATYVYSASLSPEAFAWLDLMED